MGSPMASEGNREGLTEAALNRFNTERPVAQSGPAPAPPTPPTTAPSSGTSAAASFFARKSSDDEEDDDGGGDSAFAPMPAPSRVVGPVSE
ncbi:hypothetical protein NFI96_009539 [Prochilodus magdalenae]|nr:hypothetical protein NFI96_009539 [Prochilodus magdalenae]